MKKFLGITLSVCMLLSMTACGEKNVNSEDKGSSETKVSVEEKTDTTASAEEGAKNEGTSLDDEHEYPYVTDSLGMSAVVEVYKHSEDLSDWGVYGHVQAENERIFIKYPSLTPTSGDDVAYQNDGTLVFVLPACYGSIGENISDVVSIVDGAVSATDICSIYKTMFRYLDGIVYSVEMDIVLDKKEVVTLGQFECCRGEGTLSYTSDKVEGLRVLNYVIYGTFTSEGTPFYWIVFDNSEDQSLGDVVALDAERMGYTVATEPW